MHNLESYFSLTEKYGGRQFIADKIALQLPVGGLLSFLSMILDRTLKFIAPESISTINIHILSITIKGGKKAEVLKV